MAATVRQILSLLLIHAVSCYASRVQGNTWNQVRYNGGTLQTKVDPHDWNNQLIVTSDLVTFRLKDGQTVEIPTKSVTGLSYGQEAHRRVGTMVALGILVAPLALFGLFHKTRLHFIGIEYTTQEHKQAGLLLQGHKDNYRAILMALKSATGAPLAVSAADRQYVPTAIQATVAPDQPEGKQEKPATQTAPAESSAQATMQIESTPPGADIELDGAFAGNTPSVVGVAAGEHTIKITKTGYKAWERKIRISTGTVKLAAELEKAESTQAPAEAK